MCAVSRIIQKMTPIVPMASVRCSRQVQSVALRRFSTIDDFRAPPDKRPSRAAVDRIWKGIQRDWEPTRRIVYMKQHLDKTEQLLDKGELDAALSTLGHAFIEVEGKIGSENTERVSLLFQKFSLATRYVGYNRFRNPSGIDAIADNPQPTIDKHQ